VGVSDKGGNNLTNARERPHGRKLFSSENEK
jgi:hypothetical protein